MALPWGQIISAGVGLLGSMKSKSKEGDISAAYQAGLQALAALTPPSISDLSVQLQEYVQTGEITPEEYIEYLQEKSQMEGIEIPPEVLNAQYEALNGLQDIVQNGGLTAVDRARINDIRENVLTTARGNAKRTEQEFAQRGMSGSGLEAAQRMSNDSAAIQAASKQGFDVAALAEQRALDALTKYGSQANSMRGQEFQEQSAKAQAADAINRFNTSAKQAVSNANIDARNAANAANLSERQRISDSNTDIRNKEEAARAGAVQTNFTNQLNRASGMAGQAGRVGDAMSEAAERDENRYDGYAKVGGKLGNIFGDWLAANKKPKETTETTESGNWSGPRAISHFFSTQLTIFSSNS